MKIAQGIACKIALSMALASAPASAQTLYSQDFDTNNQAGQWSINTGSAASKHLDLFFDYSTVGIPPAPNGSNTTRGMKLQANLNANAPAAGGINVSPIGQSFTGDYVLRYDMWSNFIGAEVGSTSFENLEGIWEGGSSSTKTSIAGILSSGTGDNYLTGTFVGVAEALYFGANGDAQGSIDYRVHGPGTRGGQGFRATTEAAYNAALDAGVTFHDTYPEGHPAAGTSNRGVHFDPNADPFDPNNEAHMDGFLYQEAFPSVEAPGQAAIYPTTQHNTTMPGAFGMAWREMEIKKIGNIVTWSVLNGGENMDQVITLATVDLSLLQTPATSGTNIMFGESDPTSNVGTDPDFEALQFTLVDNVRVEAIAAVDDANFDNDGDVDGHDFLIWQRGTGAAGNNSAGDANADGNVNMADFGIWRDKFGTTGLAAASSSVPEPSSAVLGLGLALAAWRVRRKA